MPEYTRGRQRAERDGLSAVGRPGGWLERLARSCDGRDNCVNVQRLLGDAPLARWHRVSCVAHQARAAVLPHVHSTQAPCPITSSQRSARQVKYRAWEPAITAVVCLAELLAAVCKCAGVGKHRSSAAGARHHPALTAAAACCPPPAASLAGRTPLRLGSVPASAAAGRLQQAAVEQQQQQHSSSGSSRQQAADGSRQQAAGSGSHGGAQQGERARPGQVHRQEHPREACGRARGCAAAGFPPPPACLPCWLLTVLRRPLGVCRSLP